MALPLQTCNAFLKTVLGPPLHRLEVNAPATEPRGRQPAPEGAADISWVTSSAQPGGGQVNEPAVLQEGPLQP